MGILRKVGVAAATGALVLVASTPASAATTGWLGERLQYVAVGNCWIGASIGTNTVTAAENYPCNGSVAAKAQWTPNGINYYYTDWKFAAEIATTGYPICQLIKVYHP